MACAICDCDNHPNRICPTCVNCIGDHTVTADYDEIHTEYVDTDGVTHPIAYAEDDVVQECSVMRTKPHYVYSGRTGELRLVESTHSDEEAVTDWDMIADAFGL